MTKHSDIVDWEKSVDLFLDDQSPSETPEPGIIEDTTSDQCPTVAPLAEAP